ncbi:hypothetical protein NDU88_000949 [Pleurodeles waltl]|uniref:Uncharacterized protein n=1 Tax=Pleurodeles waltl TaxID=8319 RepID=A0AAV7L823_PLEWA|nr:hypothetical protein NDU88_000949 [Pleurodeles waltl]
MTMRNKTMESTIYHLQEDLTKTAKERDDLLEKKETLVQEQIKILKELDEDRDEMKAELKQYQIDLNATRTTLEAEKEKNSHLEDQLASLKQEQIELNDMRTTMEAEKEKNRDLEDQLASLKQEQHSQHQLEQTVAELSLRLHELASEKRELENQVKRLESELESSLATRSENKQLRMVITIMEAKLKKVNEEFSSGNIRQQKLESQLKQATSILAQHEMDYAKSMKHWDAAITEMMTMKGQMDAMEERERQVNATKEVEASSDVAVKAEDFPTAEVPPHPPGFMTHVGGSGIHSCASDKGTPFGR